MGEVNPATGSVGMIGEAISGERKYSAAVLAGNCNIYAFPRDANQVLEVNPGSGSVQLIGGATSPIEDKYGTAVLAQTGNIFAVPCNADNVAVLVPPWNFSCESAALSCWAGALQSRMLSDLEISAKDESVHPVHKLVLAAMSPVFAAMFSAPMIEQHSSRIDLNVSSGRVLQIFSHLLYRGNLVQIQTPSLEETMEVLR